MILTAELKGVEEAILDLERVAKDSQAAIVRAITACTILIRDEAVLNAPKSPSMEMLKSLRKTKRKVHRNDRATSRASPGGLERSIESVVIPDGAKVNGIVFVSAGAEAGRYAARIHDEKGVSWRNRGPGTIVKGARADDLFILRAAMENEGNIIGIFQDETEKALKA